MDKGLVEDAAHVSVVVPVRNAALTLPLCLPALQAQNYPQSRYEIVCVDNGSTDASVELLKRCGGRVQIFSASTRGASAARNEGIRRARHPWIAFTDADCIPDPDWLRSLMRFARGPSSADFMGGRIVAFRPSTEVERFSERLFDQQRAICEFKPPYVVSANLIARRDALIDLGAFDETFLRGQDVELSFRAYFGNHATFAYVHDAVVSHVNPSTIASLWRKALQHGEASAGIIAKYGEVLGDSPWRRCSDWKRYHAIARLAAQALVEHVSRKRPAAAESGNERLYELIVAAGKQAGFIRKMLSLQRRVGSL